MRWFLALVVLQSVVLIVVFVKLDKVATYGLN